MKEIILAWGLNGCVGVTGCYLVIGGIIGKLIPIKPVMRTGVRIGRRSQRLTLGVFGLLLAMPLLLAAYKDSLYGVKTVTTAPNIKEFVETPKPVASLLRPIVYWGDGCEIREAFGLEEQQSRRLKYAQLRGNVSVGVDDIHNIYLQIGENRRNFKVKQKGDQFDFNWDGRQYRLTVVGIYSALVGPSKLAFEVCEW